MSNSPAQEVISPGSLTPSQYMAQRLQDQIDWYDKKSLWNQRWFRRLRIIEIVAAAMIPFLTSFAETTIMRNVVGAFGVIITVIAGVLALYQFQERWTEYRTTCESLKKEKYLFGTESEPYAG